MHQIDMMTAEMLEAAMREGCDLDVIADAPGIKTAKLRQVAEVRALGKGGSVELALRDLSRDWTTGGKQARGEKVPTPARPPVSPQSKLDELIADGAQMVCKFQPDGFAVVIYRKITMEFPEDLEARVDAAGGQPVRWEKRGRIYETTVARRTNTSLVLSSKQVEGPLDGRSFAYLATHTGKAFRLGEAVAAAAAAPAEEAQD